MSTPIKTDAGSPLLIKSPSDMTTLLRGSSPSQAADFALSSHERACEAGDDALADFWLAVHRELIGNQSVDCAA